MTTPLIRIENLRKSFGANEVLKGVSLEVAKGEAICIIGPSGSGKSTILRCINALVPFDQGSIQDGDMDVGAAKLDKIALRRRVGMVFQQYNLFPHRTALQNVMQPLVYRRMPPVERRERAAHALEKVGLGDRLDHRPNQLSGGQRQRVAVARALVGEPSLLLADEPTGNLDSRTSLEIMALFDALHAQGQTVVIVTHEPDIAAHCRRTIRVRDGLVVEDSLNPPRAA
jgi:putative ABC transport system ATP-binding protein